MSYGYNSISLMGDPAGPATVLLTENGHVTGHFRMAVNKSTARNGKRTTNTQWFTIKAYGGTAEKILPMIDRGKRVFVRGEFRASHYTATSGETRSISEVIAQEIIVIRGTAAYEQETATDASS